MRVDNVSYSYKGVSNGTIGGNIGVGADYPINKDFDLVGRIKYHLYFGVGEDPFINPYFGITAGLKYNIKFKNNPGYSVDLLLIIYINFFI
jgi:hypothetical protein